jgi:PAS domain S-box-containing protein
LFLKMNRFGPGSISLKCCDPKSRQKRFPVVGHREVDLEMSSTGGDVERPVAQLLQQSSDAVVVVGLEDGLIVDVNEALFAMTGHRGEDLIGRRSHDLLIWATVAGQLETVAGLRELRSVSDVPAGFRTRAGELRMGDLSVLVVGLEGGRHAVCTLRAGRDPTAVERRAVAQLELRRILRGGGSWLQMAAAAVQAVGESLRWELGAVWRVDRDGEALCCAHLWCAPLGCPQELASASAGASLRAGEGLPGRVWLTGEAAWVPDVLADPELLGERGGTGTPVHGWFAVPVAGDEVLGVLEFVSRAVRQRDEETLQILRRFVADLATVAGGGVPADPVPEAAVGLEPRPDPLQLRELARSVGRLNRLLEDIVGAEPPEPEAAPAAPAALTLKAVSERTGIPAATVRTWERRYRFLHPTRSSSGYRLYGEDDIARILQVKRLLEQGVRISEAMAVVQEQPPDGRERSAET